MDEPKVIPISQNPKANGDPNTVMGWVFAIGAAMSAVPVAFLYGGIKAASGGSFSDAFDVVEEFAEAAGSFGDKHGGMVLRKVAAGALMAVGLEGGEEILGTILHHTDT